jgi:AGZA family xanthine/uracil permease-like MFS transporter
LFKLAENKTTLRKEIIAGVTVFLTMAYIIVVNPIILSDAGMDHGAVFVATVLTSALGCLLMGLYANYPVAIAPTMGMNAYFAYAVVLNMGYSWHVALSAVFFSGILFLLLSLLKLRHWVIAAIPHVLRSAIVVGIGLFLGLIALKNIHLLNVMPNKLPRLDHVSGNPAIWLCFGGFLLIVLLEYFHVVGAILIGMMLTALLGIAMGVAHYQGIIASPPSLKPGLFALDFTPKWDLGFAVVMATFFFVSFFDATGTLMGVLHRVQPSKQLIKDPRFTRALLADSVTTIGGSLLGTSTAGCYIESAAGVLAGGRTGLTAVTVGCLFLAMLFFSPLAKTIPDFAAATALLYVACLMARGVKEIIWRDLTDSIPAAITMLATPMTCSIAEGISLGYVSYVFLKLFTGKFRQLNVSTCMLTIVFLLYLLSLYK